MNRIHRRLLFYAFLMTLMAGCGGDSGRGRNNSAGGLQLDLFRRRLACQPLLICAYGPVKLYEAFDNNLCYHASGTGSWSLNYASLDAAQSAGLDIHGLNSNLLFMEIPASTNNWDDRIQND